MDDIEDQYPSHFQESRDDYLGFLDAVLGYTMGFNDKLVQFMEVMDAMSLSTSLFRTLNQVTTGISPENARYD